MASPEFTIESEQLFSDLNQNLIALHKELSQDVSEYKSNADFDNMTASFIDNFSQVTRQYLELKKSLDSEAEEKLAEPAERISDIILQFCIHMLQLNEHLNSPDLEKTQTILINLKQAAEQVITFNYFSTPRLQFLKKCEEFIEILILAKNSPPQVSSVFLNTIISVCNEQLDLLQSIKQIDQLEQSGNFDEILKQGWAFLQKSAEQSNERITTTGAPTLYAQPTLGTPHDPAKEHMTIGWENVSNVSYANIKANPSQYRQMKIDLENVNSKSMQEEMLLAFIYGAMFEKAGLYLAALARYNIAMRLCAVLKNPKINALYQIITKANKKLSAQVKTEFPAVLETLKSELPILQEHLDRIEKKTKEPLHPETGLDESDILVVLFNIYYGKFKNIKPLLFSLYKEKNNPRLPPLLQGIIDILIQLTTSRLAHCSDKFRIPYQHLMLLLEYTQNLNQLWPEDTHAYLPQIGKLLNQITAHPLFDASQFELPSDFDEMYALLSPHSDGIKTIDAPSQLNKFKRLINQCEDILGREACWIDPSILIEPFNNAQILFSMLQSTEAPISAEDSNKFKAIQNLVTISFGSKTASSENTPASPYHEEKSESPTQAISSADPKAALSNAQNILKKIQAIAPLEIINNKDKLTQLTKKLYQIISTINYMEHEAEWETMIQSAIRAFSQAALTIAVKMTSPPLQILLIEILLREHQKFRQFSIFGQDFINEEAKTINNIVKHFMINSPIKLSLFNINILQIFNNIIMQCPDQHPKTLAYLRLILLLKATHEFLKQQDYAHMQLTGNRLQVTPQLRQAKENISTAKRLLDSYHQESTQLSVEINNIKAQIQVFEQFIQGIEHINIMHQADDLPSAFKEGIACYQQAMSAATSEDFNNLPLLLALGRFLDQTLTTGTNYDIIQPDEHTVILTPIFPLIIQQIKGYIHILRTTELQSIQPSQLNAIHTHISDIVSFLSSLALKQHAGAETLTNMMLELLNATIELYFHNADNPCEIITDCFTHLHELYEIISQNQLNQKQFLAMIERLISLEQQQLEACQQTLDQSNPDIAMLSNQTIPKLKILFEAIQTFISDTDANTHVQDRLDRCTQALTSLEEQTSRRLSSATQAPCLISSGASNKPEEKMSSQRSPATSPRPGQSKQSG